MTDIARVSDKTTTPDNINDQISMGGAPRRTPKVKKQKSKSITQTTTPKLKQHQNQLVMLHKQ